MRNGDKPAFSSLHTIDGNWQKEPLKEYQGLTKREYLASAAMIGLLSNPNIKRPHPDFGPLDKQYYDFTKICLEYSDELLKQLES